MNKLTDVGIRVVLAKSRTGRVELVDGAVPGLVLRIGKTRAATWSLMIRVAGEGGITGRGRALMGPKRRLTLGAGFFACSAGQGQRIYRSGEARRESG